MNGDGSMKGGIEEGIDVRREGKIERGIEAWRGARA